MSFNFARAKQNAVKDLTNDKLGLLVLAQGGDGKSTLCGTFGVPTLLLYWQGESHGVLSAKSMGGTVDAIRLDLDDEGVKLTPDLSYDRLLAILGESEGIKAAGYQAVVIDSLSELESVIRSTQKFKVACQTDKGAHNSFAEGNAVIGLMRGVFTRLKDLQLNLGIHFACTCPLNVVSKEDNGEIAEASPKLSTYSVAENVVLQFADIVTVGRMVNKEGKAAHRIQFGTSVSKESKTANGTVKKFLQFSPRLAGVMELPSHMAADLSKLAELKAKGVNNGKA